jgi:hypothetical protein
MPIQHTFRVPTAPFVAWLRVRATKYGGVKPYAEKVEVDHLWLGRLMAEEFKTIAVTKVDAIMCKDDTAHIRELYPELYEE